MLSGQFLILIVTRIPHLSTRPGSSRASAPLTTGRARSSRQVVGYDVADRPTHFRCIAYSNPPIEGTLTCADPAQCCLLTTMATVPAMRSLPTCSIVFITNFPYSIRFRFLRRNKQLFHWPPRDRMTVFMFTIAFCSNGNHSAPIVRSQLLRSAALSGSCRENHLW
jgi:hypothetical protein